MEKLDVIKRHVGDHGIGCVIMGDRVAISTLWTSKALDGEERLAEVAHRVTSFQEACGVIGCHCDESKPAEAM